METRGNHVRDCGTHAVSIIDIINGSRRAIAHSLVIALSLMLTIGASDAASNIDRGWEGWHTVRGPNISYRVANDRVQEISNLDRGCEVGGSPYSFGGRIVKVEFASDAITIRGIVVEPPNGGRFYVNVAWPSMDLPGMNMAELGWIIEGLQQLLRKDNQIEGDVRPCGAAGRFLDLTNIKLGNSTSPLNTTPAVPIKPSQPAEISSVSNPTIIEMIGDGGAFRVPVTVNNTVTLNFIVDSGASDVVIPVDVVMTLVRAGTITDADFLGKQTYQLADGSKLPSQQFVLRSLKVGNRVLERVTGTIAPVHGGLLLGQSFLSRFKSWSINNQNGTLLLN